MSEHRLVAYTNDGRKWISEPADCTPEEWESGVDDMIESDSLTYLVLDGWRLPIQNVTAFKMMDEKDI